MTNPPASNAPKPAPLISVLIIAYQSGETLGRCLAALEAQSFRDFEIILVDNASTDGAPQAALADGPGPSLIAAGTNLGFAAGNNLAAQAARGRWLALLNPDAYPQPDWLDQLVRASQALPAIKSFASLQVRADDPARLDGAGDVLTLAGIPYRGGYGQPVRPLPMGEVFSACGAAHLIDRALFLALGGFDETFFCYCEDVDLGYRLRLIGQATVLVPEAVVAHVGSAVFGARSDFSLFHGTRNRLWCLVKNTPWPLVPLVAVLHLFALVGIFGLHLMRGEIKPVWRGLMAALKGLGPVLEARKAIQAGRTASSGKILRALANNPLDLIRRAVVINPLKP